jgi:hypothetical protein
MPAVYKEYEITVSSDAVTFPNGIVLRGTSLAKHLSGCERCAVVAATLGAEADKELKRLQYSDLAEAVLSDGRANAAIEALVDGLQETLAKRAAEQGLFLTARYSPGYGDFSLDSQSDLLRLTDAEKKIGLTVNGNNLLLPVKSVTAVIGYAKTLKAPYDRCQTCPSREKCVK